MPKKSPKLRPDVNETAYRTMQEAAGDTPKTLPPSERPQDAQNPDAVVRGSKGGKKGGRARAIKLSEEARADSATIAALARWKKAD